MSRRIRYSSTALLLGSILLLPGAAGAAESGITLKNAWVRLIVSVRPAAGYFTLDNTTAQPKTLIGARSPACGQLMLHRSMQDSGQEKMVMVKQVTVPARGSLSFTPGDYHLMCMQPAPTMKVGGSVPVTLTFADGGTLTADFPVKGASSP